MAILPRNSLLVLAAVPAGAKPPAKPDPKAAQAGKIALAVTDQFVIPTYQALVQACEAEEKAWTVFAAKREAGDFASLRAAYNGVADAWANAQLIKTGPITLFLRYDRFAYWPEARNATARALDQLLMSKNPKDLTAESLAHDSVAGQGLTALERLLYDGDNPEKLLKAAGAEGAWRTQVGVAIAHNLATIAHQVLADWTAPNGVRAAIAANKGWNNLFADAPEAARLLLTDLVAGFKLMHDVKLLPVLGANADAAKPKSAEAWRSGRSQRDLKLNLASAQGLEMAFATGAPAAHRTKFDALFAAATKAVDAIPADMGEAAADAKRRPRVDAARVAIKAVQTELAKTLPGDVGVTLGFNSLDGD
ncbi:MAG TPA: imelysin family protein [Micropepsaceae bacterium]|nr:imelysin family protein [Micropepsaceae bacterium]